MRDYLARLKSDAYELLYDWSGAAFGPLADIGAPLVCAASAALLFYTASPLQRALVLVFAAAAAVSLIRAESDGPIPRRPA